MRCSVPQTRELLGPVRSGVAVLACILALGACARSIGQPITADAVERLTPGKTTYANAVQQFGKATRIKGQGSRIVAHWHYLKDTPDGTEYDSLRIMFDENGRMVRIVEWLDSGEEEEES